MSDITICRITPDNFNEYSLDEFDRSQESHECWRPVNGEYTLVPEHYIKNWSLEQCRDTARTIVDGVRGGSCFGYAAFVNGKSVGQIFLSKERFGSRNQYILLKMLHISAPWRGRGLGKALFSMACEEARLTGAEKLYISANHTKESQAAYFRLGCVYAQEIDPILAAKEPQDVQMEYIL